MSDALLLREIYARAARLGAKNFLLMPEITHPREPTSSGPWVADWTVGDDPMHFSVRWTRHAPRFPIAFALSILSLVVDTVAYRGNGLAPGVATPRIWAAAIAGRLREYETETVYDSVERRLTSRIV